MQQSAGVAVLNPHGDLVERLLGLIPLAGVERTLYFNPGDPDWVPLWNLLSRIPGHDPARTADDLVSTETIFRLEQGYRNNETQGWIAAVVDGLDVDHNGFESVVSRLIDGIKADQREKYLRWIWVVHFHALDWQFKYGITEVLLARLQIVLPAHFQKYSPALFIDDISVLIQLHLQTNKLLQQLLTQPHF